MGFYHFYTMKSRYMGLIWLLGLYVFGGCTPAPPVFDVEFRGRLSDTLVYPVSQQEDVFGRYALGEYLDSAVTFLVFNGRSLSSRLAGDKPNTEAMLPPVANFLFSAEVETWQSLTLPRHVQNRLDLEIFLLGAAEAYGIDLYAPFPFQIRGRAAKLHYRLPACRNGERPRLQDSLSNQDIEAIGFFTNQQTDRSTPSPDERLHIHFQTTDRSLTGHLLEVVPQQMELWLPGSRGESRR